MPNPERLAGWMRQRLQAAGGAGFVVGLSGGVDSAVVARLAQLAAPNNAAGQKDEEEIGVSYAELDRYITEGPPGAAPALAMKIERLARASDHKRELPPVPDFD